MQVLYRQWKKLCKHHKRILNFREMDLIYTREVINILKIKCHLAPYDPSGLPRFFIFVDIIAYFICTTSVFNTFSSKSSYKTTN